MDRAEGTDLNKGSLPAFNMLEDRPKEPTIGIELCRKSKWLEAASS
jgi:hypothetical protein